MIVLMIEYVLILTQRRKRMKTFGVERAKSVFVWVILLAALSLAGCAAEPAQTETVTPASTPTMQTLETYPLQEEPAAEVLAASPTPRPALEATDPATVKLAAGKVQLVEFFAFW
mgnify:CR=1 FL=1